MAFSQLGYQYIRPIYPSSDRPGNGGGGGGGGSRNELSPSGTLSSVLSSMYGAPYAAAAAAAQGYGAFLPYAAAELPIFPQLGAQYELKESPGVQHAGFSPHHPAFYPYGQYQFGDPSRPKNATRESTSTLKAWLNEHRKNPYPTKGEKIMLAIITKMTLTQVSTWFANARRRLKKENKMTWAPRSRTDEEEEEEELEEEEGNAYGSEHEGEGGKRLAAEAEDEEIDLENVETENGESAPSVRDGDLGGGGCQRLLEGEGGEEDEEDEGLEEEERAEEAAILASDGKTTDSDGSDVGFEDFPDGGGGRERFLLKAVEEARQLVLPLPTRRLSPPASPPTAAPSPALLPPPPPPSKPKIWSLAETATSPDTPSRKSPPAPSSGAPSSLKLVGNSPPAAQAHRLVSACPLGKFAAGWASTRPFSAHPPHHPHHHHHHHSHHPHALTLLNAPHLLGLSGGNPSSGPNTVTVAAAAALAAFSRPAETAQSPEAADGTDRSSALEVEKKLIKTAFHPVQRRPQNQLDAAMVLSALSSS